MVNLKNIPPSIKITGLKRYCLKGQKVITDICCETGKNIGTCKCKDKHRWKYFQHIKGTKRGRKTLTFSAKDKNEAIRIVLDVQENGKNLLPSQTVTGQAPEIVKGNGNQPILLVDCIAHFVAYANGEFATVYQKKKGAKHIADTERYLKYFVEALVKKHHPVGNSRLDEIDEVTIDAYQRYLKDDLYLSQWSQRKAIRIVGGMYNYFIKKKHYPIRNPFQGIEVPSPVAEIKAFPEENLKPLIELMRNKDVGKQYRGGELRSMYKPLFMPEAVELGIHTGRRVSEIAICMKWNGFTYNKNGEPKYLDVVDLKASRLKGGQNFQQAKLVHVPITPPLYDLLLRMGFEKHKGTDAYILAPDESMKRETISTFISRSFTHYYKALTGEHLTFKSLRKLYISKMTELVGPETARLVIGHSDLSTTSGHYISTEYLAEKIAENSRKNKLHNLRQKTNPNTLER